MEISRSSTTFVTIFCARTKLIRSYEGTKIDVQSHFWGRIEFWSCSNRTNHRQESDAAWLLYAALTCHLAPSCAWMLRMVPSDLSLTHSPLSFSPLCLTHRGWRELELHRRRCSLKQPDFHEGKSTESKCNKTIVDHITQISSLIPHPYNDNIRVQIVQNYIIYYIAALAESKVAFIQNSLKIRSPNSSVGTNPSTIKLLGAKLLSRTCVPKFISTICTGHFHPMSIALWELDASEI